MRVEFEILKILWNIFIDCFGLESMTLGRRTSNISGGRIFINITNLEHLPCICNILAVSTILKLSCLLPTHMQNLAYIYLNQLHFAVTRPFVTTVCKFGMSYRNLLLLFFEKNLVFCNTRRGRTENRLRIVARLLPIELWLFVCCTLISN